MRFFLDEDVNPAVAEIARRRGLDAVSVHEIDRRGLSDEEQLRFSAREGRLLVTRNRDDFIQLTVSFFQASQPHAGLLIVPRSLPNRDPERIAGALLRWVDEKAGSGEADYRIDFLAS